MINFNVSVINKCFGSNFLTSFLFLLFCICFGFFLIFLTDGQTSPLSLVLRYVVMPLSAFWFGLALANYIVDRMGARNMLNKQRRFRFFVMALVTYCITFIILKTLKSISFNYELFDAGLYVSKLWRINAAGWSKGWYLALGEGHFQVMSGIYAWIYGWLDSPLLPYAMETVTLASGAIPIYLLANNKLSSHKLALLLALTYLLNPLVQFNDILGFHPDHIVLPATLWAFYFAETDQYKKAIAALVLASFGGEQWIPCASAFGVYLWLGRGQRLLGISIAITFMALFAVLLFWALPMLGSENSGSSVFSPYGLQSAYWELTSGSPSLILKMLLDPKKAFFVFFLLFPFLFLPFRSWAIMIVAIPDFVKTMGSGEMLHYSVEGHYTLALIAVIFVAYIDALPKLADKYGHDLHIKLPVITAVITLTFSIAHSPLPISFDFWSNWSAGTYNYKNYLSGERVASLRRAENLIGLNPSQKIEISNAAFTPNLARRYHKPERFPSEDWMNCDFILLDKDKYKGAGSHRQQEQYLIKFNKAQSQIPERFRLLIDDTNLELWERIDKSESSLGAVQ